MSDMFKGVLWDHGTVIGPDGKTYHKTVVVGVLLSEDTVETSTTGSHHFVMGTTFDGMAPLLSGLHEYKASMPVGDAMMVLTGMDLLQPAVERDPCWGGE